jgi:hypothetical protein
VYYGANQVQAVFAPDNPSYYWVTLQAIGYEGQVDCGLYVDGNYVGTGYGSAEVIQGYHSIYVDTGGNYFYNWQIDQGGGSWYPTNNPQGLDINSDTSAIAWVGI